LVVHRLSWEFHAPGDARGGIGLDQGCKNLEPKRMMEQYGGLGGLANEVESGASSRRGEGRRAGARDFPIAAAGDAHGFEGVLPRNASAVSNGLIILSRPSFWSIITRTLFAPLWIP